MEEKVETIRKLTNFKFNKRDILVDLQYTQSVEETLSRIFEGQFLSNTFLHAAESDDSESDGIEIIGVQKSQKVSTIELLSSPDCSRQRSPICFSNKLIEKSSKSTDHCLEEFQNSRSLPEKSGFLNSSSDDELVSSIHRTEFELSELHISTITDEYDMSFLHKRNPLTSDRFLNFQIPLAKYARNASANKKNVPSAERKLEKKKSAQEKQRLVGEKGVAQAIKSANVFRQKITAAEEIVVSFCSEWKQDPSSKAIVESIIRSGARLVSSKHSLSFTMSFSRIVNREFDFFGSGAWKPCLERIEVEPYTLLYLPADKLARIINEKNGLVSYLSRVMAAYPGHTYIYLIEDLTSYHKKRKRLVTKYENDCLRTAMGERPVKRKEDIVALLKEMPEPKDFENSLALLQNFGKGKCKIHFSPASETAGWIVSFIQQIAIFPEMQYFNILTFSVHSTLNLQCADIKSGKDAKDTMIKMLQEITSVTSRTAQAIVKVYPNCNVLISALCEVSLDEARKLLIGIPVESASAGGAKKFIGAIQAKKIADVLMGN